MAGDAVMISSAYFAKRGHICGLDLLLERASLEPCLFLCILSSGKISNSLASE